MTDESAFRKALAGTYVHARIPDWTLTLELSGDCAHEDSQCGVQGSSSTERIGRWTRRPDGDVELHWTRSRSELEVGMRTDRSSKAMDWVEVVRPRWEGERVVEILFVDGTPYLRR